MYIRLISLAYMHTHIIHIYYPVILLVRAIYGHICRHIIYEAE